MIERVRNHLNYRAVGLLRRKNLPIHLKRPIVSFTFDDFPKSAWTVGGEILMRHDARGTYYLCARHCGLKVDGLQQYDREDLVEISAQGHELGCHTAQHLALPDHDNGAIHADLTENEAFLTGVVPHQRMTTFAYPYGAVSLRTKRLASEEFAACRGVWPGVNVNRADLALLRCVCLEPHILAERSISAWIEETVRVKGWLVFLTHDVSENPTAFGVTPQLLEQAVTTAMSHGCIVLPVKDALRVASREHSN